MNETEWATLEASLRSIVEEMLEPHAKIIKSFATENTTIDVGLAKQLQSLPFFMDKTQAQIDELILSLRSSVTVGTYANAPLMEELNQFLTFNGVRYFPVAVPYQTRPATYPDPADDPNLLTGDFVTLSALYKLVFGLYQLNYVGAYVVGMTVESSDVLLEADVAYILADGTASPYTTEGVTASADTGLQTWDAVATETIKARVTALESALTALTDRVSTVEQTLSTQADTINTVSQAQDAQGETLTTHGDDITALQNERVYRGAWSSATGAAKAGQVFTHNGYDWILKVDVLDITQSEPSFLNSSFTELLGELKSVSVATGYPIAQCDFLRIGTPLNARVLRHTESEVTLISWSSNLPSTYTINSFSENNFGGYDVVTNLGTFEFVTKDIFELRSGGNGRYIKLARETNLFGWGVKANGVDIDRTQVQKAIDYVYSLGGGDIYAPDGVYMFDAISYYRDEGTNLDQYGICSIILKDNVHIRGGRNAIFKVVNNAYGANAFYRLIASQYTSRLKHASIHGITIDGNSQNQVAGVQASNIQLECENDVLVEWVQSINSNGNGIRLVGTTSAPATDLKVKNCLVNGCTFIGIQISHFIGAQITDNVVLNTGDNCLDIYGDEGSSTTVTSTGFEVNGNICRNGRVGLFCETVAKGSATSNIFSSMTDYGLVVNRIHGQPNDVQITANTIFLCPVSISITSDSRGISIESNTCSGFTIGGLRLGSSGGVCSYVNIFDNTFRPADINIPVIFSNAAGLNFCIGKFNKVILAGITEEYLFKNEATSTTRTYIDSFLVTPSQVGRDLVARDPLFSKTSTLTGQELGVAGPIYISPEINTAGTITITAYKDGVGSSVFTIQYIRTSTEMSINTVNYTYITSNPITNISVSGGSSVAVELRDPDTNVTYGINCVPMIVS